MTKLLTRLLAGAVFALPLALLTFALAQASPARQDTGPTESPECQDCHASHFAAWEQGAHGQALSDPAFVESWERQGQPKECLACHTTGYDPETGAYAEAGVSCALCHDPVPADHPLSPASVTRSSEMCGNCHRDTQFEWQNSRHGQSELTCVSCHEPHASTIKTEDVSALCASCHGTRVEAFAHSQHAAEGLTCADCHISPEDSEPGMGTAKQSHTFEVNLDTCTKCHEYEIHNPAAAMLVDGQGTPVPPDSMNSGHPSVVSTTPQAVSPIGFAVFTGLIGMALGIVLAPWLERGLRRFAQPEKSLR